MSVNAPAAEQTQRQREKERGGREFRPLNVFSHGFLILWSVLVVFPLLWTIFTSFKTDHDIFTSPWKLPSTLHFSNFSRAWKGANIGTYFVNTIVVVAGGFSSPCCSPQWWPMSWPATPSSATVSSTTCSSPA